MAIIISQKNLNDFPEEELLNMTITEIKALASELGYSITETKKADIISEFLTQQGEQYMYVDYEYYKTLYGDKALAENDFNRLSWDAEKEIDKATSGVDGVKKLKIAFPTDEYNAECVKRCVCDLIVYLSQLEKARNTMLNDGGIVSSKSAGNESISYSNIDTDVNKALASVEGKEKAVYSFITESLRGVTDANGVCLLYLGKYPTRIEV